MLVTSAIVTSHFGKSLYIFSDIKIILIKYTEDTPRIDWDILIRKVSISLRNLFVSHL